MAQENGKENESQGSNAMDQESLTRTDQSTEESTEFYAGTSSHSAFQNNDRAVGWSRLLVFVVLAAAASILGYLTYIYVENEEMENFRSEFENIADEIITVSQENVKTVFGVLDGLSVVATSHALNSGSEFPFVTLPHMAEQGKHARSTSQALIIAFLPLVAEINRQRWEEYSLQHQDWIAGSYPLDTEIQPIRDQIHAYGPKETQPPAETMEHEHDRYRRRLSEQGTCGTESRRMLKERVPEPKGTGPYAPVWQVSPAPPANDTDVINYNLFDKPVFEKAMRFIDYTRKAAFLDVCNQAAWFGGHYSNTDVLQTVVVQPVFESFQADAPVVGSFAAIIPWHGFFESIVHSGAPEVRVVLSNTCNEVFTFSVQGSRAVFLEEEDLHDPGFDDMRIHAPFAEFANPKELLEADLGEHCVYHISVYPTHEMLDSHSTHNPIYYCFLVLAVFFFTSIIFILYDSLVRRRQMGLMKANAEKHEQLVSSLFPANVRDRVIHARQDLAYQTITGGSAKDLLNTKPIADLFPSSTVMFADIAGFTAWSSLRSPEEVFNLLETLYHSFDVIAQREDVFKVETIGDSYVAATGIPESRPDHVLVMANFARSCMKSFGRLTRQLEQKLGPDTTTLEMRIGLHSGPVTGGVLRGAKARFQLFGDTVNVAARMESTGLPGKIQVSRETADLLREQGQESQIEPRTDLVLAKGKGCLETYWLKIKVPRHPACVDSTTSQDSEGLSDDTAHAIAMKLKCHKLIQWNCSMLLPHLRSIVARRQVTQPTRTPPEKLCEVELELNKQYVVKSQIQEVIDLPAFVSGTPEIDPNSIELDKEVEEQLRQYVSLISDLYEDNPFHCFEHASHVTMSTSKMLARIVNRTTNSLQQGTYGISDPLTQFAIILSALLHDADHAGIPNNALAEEDPTLAAAYTGKSVAEQNSVDKAWAALMQPEFHALRNCIYCNETELRRFRSIVVNSVMATDIFEAELAALRKARWNRVFHKESGQNDEGSLSVEDINRKATLVIEHLIQASDVAHTMQHWLVYLEWNSRLFEELYTSYRLGRTEKDPSEGWFKGELWFFDNYVIPLAQKLKECGVFGVSSDEYLNYAVKNRREWELRGEQIVAEMVAKITSSFDLEQAVAAQQERSMARANGISIGAVNNLGKENIFECEVEC